MKTVSFILAATGNRPRVMVYPFAKSSKSRRKQVSDAPINISPTRTAVIINNKI